MIATGMFEHCTFSSQPVHIPLSLAASDRLAVAACLLTERGTLTVTITRIHRLSFKQNRCFTAR